jgi:copper chaperone CopZ
MFFGLFKDKTKDRNLDQVKIKSGGLHCSSCAVNIDLTLEDLPGVVNSKTNYAKSETDISYDPKSVDIKALKKAIESLGYKVETTS